MYYRDYSVKKFAKGGKMANDKQFDSYIESIMPNGVDLFEDDGKHIPEKVLKILNKYDDAFTDGNWQLLSKANEELNKKGYTFEFNLSGKAYDLRKIGQKGKVSDNVEDVGDIPIYEDGIMVSKPYYYIDKDELFTFQGYAIYDKFNDYSSARFVVSNGIASKKDALDKANRYYEFVKRAKTKDEYENLAEEFVVKNRKEEYEKMGIIEDMAKGGIMATGGNIAGITEKDFANNRVIKRGNIEIELSKDFPTHYYAHFIDIRKDRGELVSVYANKNWNKVVKEIETFKYEMGGEMADGGMMSNGDKIMKHKHNQNITIELIEPTNKGWKVKQIETHSIKGKKLSTPKEKIAYFSKEEIKDLFENKMADGGMMAKGGNVEDEFMGFNVMINTKNDYNKFKKLYVSDADEMGDNTLFFSFNDENNANKKIIEIENHLKQLNIEDYFIQNVYSSEFN